MPLNAARAPKSVVSVTGTIKGVYSYFRKINDTQSISAKAGARDLQQINANRIISEYRCLSQIYISA